jgi:hypothetical protein
MEERRGRPITIVQEPATRKFSRVYEDEETTTTWTFDLDKFDRGPVSVDIKYKVGADKAIKARAKEIKQIKKTARQMKKINNKNKKWHE